MNILITGGTGFLGRRLGETLQAEGHQVTMLGRNRTIGQSLIDQGFKFQPIDLSDRQGIVASCQGQSAVFHCGALSSPWGRYSDFFESNVLGTRHVIEGCQRFGVDRLIHVSTASVYFEFCDRTQISELDPLPARPVNAYAATKRQAEQEIQTAHRAGLPVITIRPRGIIGPGDTALLPRLIRASDRTGIPLIDQGKALTDVTYVDNVVTALRLCLQAPSHCLGRVYNITNGQPMSLERLLNRVFTRLDYPFQTRPMSFKVAYGLAWAFESWARLTRGPEPILTRYTVGLLSKSQTLDISAAQRDLNYHPAITLEAGLDQFAIWYAQHGVPL